MFAVNAAAQVSISAKEKEFVDGSGDRLLYTIGFLVVASFGVAFYLWRKSKRGVSRVTNSYENRYRGVYSNKSYETEGVDAEKELEWLRKAKKSSSKSQQMTFGPKAATGAKNKITAKTSAGLDEESVDTKLFQEKMRKLQYALLPITSFSVVPS